MYVPNETVDDQFNEHCGVCDEQGIVEVKPPRKLAKRDVGMECMECGNKFRAKLSTLQYGKTKCPKCKSTDLDFAYGESVEEEVEIEEEFWAVIDKAKGGEVMAVSSDEKGAKSSVKMSNFSKHDYHFNKDPRTLKIVKVAGSYKKGEKMIGTKLSFKEEVEITEAVHDKKSTFTMAPFEDLRSVADAALKIMTRQPQEVKEEEKEEVTKEDQPQSLTE
jgi:phage FluMu protein Com